MIVMLEFADRGALLPCANKYLHPSAWLDLNTSSMTLWIELRLRDVILHFKGILSQRNASASMGCGSNLYGLMLQT